jgi:urate oxidase
MLEYKTEKIGHSEDWESIRNKYNDIWEHVTAQISEIFEERSTEDFPHAPEEITKAMVTSKLKGKCFLFT